MEKQENIPQLRFPEFDQSWDKNRLGEVVKINQGLQIAISERYTEQVQDSYFYITNEFIKAKSDKKYYIKNPPKSVLCSKDDILMTRTGNTGIVVTDVEGAFHNNFFKVAYPEYISKGFLYEFLSLSKTQNIILKLAGTSTIPDLNHSDFYRIEITYPSIQEQQKIASFFTAIDHKISQLKQKKTLLEQYKKGVMQKIFSQEIRFKDDNGKEFPKWEKKRLGDVCRINPTSETLPKEFIYIDLESVVKGSLIKEDTITDLEAPSRAQRVLMRKDILFQMVRPYQMNNFYFDLNGTYVASTGYAQIRTEENSLFIYHILHLRKFVNDVIERCTGTSYPAINSKDLSMISILIPSLPEQIKIANFLSAIDNRINQTQYQIEKTELWKKGLLQKMFV